MSLFFFESSYLKVFGENMFCLSKKNIFVLLSAFVFLVSTGCTEEKRTLSHPPQNPEKQETSPKGDPQDTPTDKSLKSPQKPAPGDAQVAPEDPSSHSDLPEGQDKRGKVTRDGQRRHTYKKDERVFEKGHPERSDQEPQVPEILGNNEHDGVVIEYYDSSNTLSGELHPRMRDEKMKASVVAESFADLKGKPLDITYLPTSTNELQSCNVQLHTSIHDPFTGGVEPESGRRFTTGRKNGVMAFLKSLIRCQEPSMQAASLQLAAHLMQPTVKVYKNTGQPKGRAVVYFDVFNAGDLERFRLEGDLVGIGGAQKVVSTLRQTYTSNTKYEFRGKLICVDSNGSCENTIVTLEQVISDKVCKRVYFSHSFGDGRAWTASVTKEAIDAEINIAKKNFMQLMDNTSVRANLIRKALAEGNHRSIEFPKIPEGQDALGKMGLAISAVAYGASFFEVSMFPLKVTSDMFYFRGPLYRVMEGDEPVNLEFGQEVAAIVDVSSFLTELNPKLGRSSQLYSPQLIFNNGKGALSIHFQFLGPITSPLRVDFGDDRILPVIELQPQAFLP